MLVEYITLPDALVRMKLRASPMSGSPTWQASSGASLD